MRRTGVVAVIFVTISFLPSMKETPELSKAEPFPGNGPVAKAAYSRHLFTALPANYAGNENLVYVEPFIGSGAVLFWFLQRFQKPEGSDQWYEHRSVKSLCGCKDLPETGESPYCYWTWYYSLHTIAAQHWFYLEKRERFNIRTVDAVEILPWWRIYE